MKVRTERRKDVTRRRPRTRVGKRRVGGWARRATIHLERTAAVSQRQTSTRRPNRHKCKPQNGQSANGTKRDINKE